jgi:hypothetical protein
LNDDPTRPNEDYFRHVDWVIQKANSLGIVVGLLPTWGDKYNRLRGKGPEIFTPKNARVFGEWLGRRYAKRNAYPGGREGHLPVLQAQATRSNGP